MSLCWPEHKVALNIVDDPQSSQFDRAAHPDYHVIDVTSDTIRDLEALNAVANDLARRLGQEVPPPTPEFRAAQMRLHAELMGISD